MAMKQWFRGTRKPAGDFVKFGASRFLYIYIGKSLMEKYFSKTHYVNILYDEKRKSIGIQPTHKKNGAMKIYCTHQKSTGFICGRGLSRLEFVKALRGERHKAVWNERLKLIEVKKGRVA